MPRTAITTDDADTAVFVVTGGTAKRHVLTVVDWPAARLIVTAGLTEGDVVITDATDIVDGQTVAADQP